MTALTLGLLLGGLCFGGGATMVFIWAVRSGHFDDLEDIKYQLMRDEESG